MMAEADNNNDDLERLFARARQGAGRMPQGLSQRILADADQIQAGFSGVGTGQMPARGRGPWAQVLTALGGWPAMGGLAAACAAGVWIGLAPPSFLPDPAGLVTGAGGDIDLIDVNELFAALPEEG